MRKWFAVTIVGTVMACGIGLASPLEKTLGSIAANSRMRRRRMNSF